MEWGTCHVSLVLVTKSLSMSEESARWLGHALEKSKNRMTTHCYREATQLCLKESRECKPREGTRGLQAAKPSMESEKPYEEVAAQKQSAATSAGRRGSAHWNITHQTLEGILENRSMHTVHTQKPTHTRSAVTATLGSPLAHAGLSLLTRHVRLAQEPPGQDGLRLICNRSTCLSEKRSPDPHVQSPIPVTSARKSAFIAQCESTQANSRQTLLRVRKCQRGPSLTHVSTP